MAEAEQKVPELLYFPLRARADPVRMVAKYTGFEFKDRFVSFPEWGELKQKMPNGQLPVLQKADGELMPESCDIALYVAENGKKKIVCDEEAQVLFAKCQNVPLAKSMPLLNFFGQDDVLDNKPLTLAGMTMSFKDFLKEAEEEFKNLDQQLQKTEGAFFAGNQVGMGDLGILFIYGNMIALQANFGEEFLSEKFKAWVDSTKNLDGVKEYLMQRPKCGTGKVGNPTSIAAVDKCAELFQTPELIYFSLRARADPIRMVAKYTGFEFEDRFVSFAEWPELKKTMPKGQLPVLVKADGENMAESCDIALYAAENGTKSIICDQAARDLFAKCQSPPLSKSMPLLNFFAKADVLGDKELTLGGMTMKLKDFLKEAEEEFKSLDGELQKSDGPFFAGKEVGMGDLGILFIYGNLIALQEGFGDDFLSKKFHTWVRKTKELDGVKDYLYQRPKFGTREVGNPNSIAALDSCAELSDIPELIYFSLRARADPIRMIAKYTGFEFDDRIVSFAEWPELKQQMPNGQVPVLVKANGRKMPESCDIALYVAESGMKSIVCDQAAQDLFAKCQNLPLLGSMPLLNFFSKEDVLADNGDNELTLGGMTLTLNAFLKTAEEEFKKLDIELEKVDGPFFAGKEVGMGDLGILFIYGNMIALKKDFGEAFLSEKFKAWVHKTKTLDGVKEYLADRPKCGTGEIGKPTSIAALDKCAELFETPELYYFSLRARADPIRMIAEYTGFEFNDRFVSFAEWPELKQKMPNGQLPVLIKADGKMMPESCDIALHVAENGMKSIVCDQAAMDLFAKCQNVPLAKSMPLLNFFAKDDVLENKPLELGEMKMTLQGFLKEAEAEFKALDDELKKMDGPFFAGKEVGMGDLGILFIYGNMIALQDDFGDDFLSGKFKKWIETTRNLDGVKEYLTKRPKFGTGETGNPTSIAFNDECRELHNCIFFVDL